MTWRMARRWAVSLHYSLAVAGGLAMAVPARAADEAEAPTRIVDADSAKSSRQVKTLTNELDNQVADLTHARFLLHGTVENLFGATLAPPDKALRAQLELPANHALVVSNVTPGGPAAQVGLQNNDILLALNGTVLSTSDTLNEALKGAGEKPATLSLIRAGKPLEIQIKPVYRVTFGPAAPESRRYFIGVQINTPDDLIRAHVKDLPSGQGLIASDILPDSPALKAGLKPFDILLECGGKALREPEDLVASVQGSQGKPLTLKVLRGGKTQTFEVTPEPRKEAVSHAQTLSDYYVLLQPSAARYEEAVRHLGAVHQPGTPVLAPYNHTVASQPPGTLAQRLDALTAEVANLRKALDELKNALKRDMPQK